MWQQFMTLSKRSLKFLKRDSRRAAADIVAPTSARPSYAAAPNPANSLFIATKNGRIGSCNANASSAGRSQKPSTSTDARGQGWPQATAERP